MLISSISQDTSILNLGRQALQVLRQAKPTQSLKPNDVMFFKVQKNDTRPFLDIRVEQHKKYHDFFIMLEGKELCFRQPEANPPADYFMDDKDIGFAPLDIVPSTPIVITDSHAVHFAPEEWHSSQIRGHMYGDNIKIVLKVLKTELWPDGYCEKQAIADFKAALSVE